MMTVKLLESMTRLLSFIINTKTAKEKKRRNEVVVDRKGDFFSKIFKFPYNLDDEHDDTFSKKVGPDVSFCVGDVGKSTHDQT